VDDLSGILELREAFEKKGLTFYIHIDGAWGGYFASVLWNRRMQRCSAARQSSRLTGIFSDWTASHSGYMHSDWSESPSGRSQPF
jgi:glutamate/tyrosine decarboxylase-like PLP-dependent enzyme